MTRRLLITEPEAYSEGLITQLSEQFDVECVSIRDSQAFRLMLRQRSPDALLVGLGLQLSKAELDVVNSLRVIACPATGTDHIDVQDLRSRGIELISLQGQSSELYPVSGTAELAWALLLMLARGLANAVSSVQEGFWNRAEHVGTQLRNKTLAVVGHGRLGGFVAEYGRAFGMKVLIVDPSPTGRYENSELVDLETAFRQSDAISVHVPLNPGTRRMINTELLGNCKKNLLLVNTSRGEIVDEGAIADAIRNGVIAGYATDVIASDATWSDHVEPNFITPLIGEGFNVIVTPHIGGYTREGIDITRQLVVRDLLDWASRNP